jgi:hypothetical protein
MDGNTIPVDEKTTIIVKASGDLFLEGQDSSEVHFQSSEDRIRVHQSNDTLFVETHSSMDLTVPRQGKIIVEKVGGSALIQDLGGSLTVQKIGGDLAMQRLGSVRIEKVGGSCLIQGISDGLSIGKAGGDLTMRDVTGGVVIGNIGGEADLQVRTVNSLETKAGGDIRMYITEGLTGKVFLRAGGDVMIYLPSNASGHFVLLSSGESIAMDLSRQSATIHETIDSRRYEFSLGENNADNTAYLEAQAGGDIMVSDEAVEPESISDDLERREEAWKEARDRRGSASWSGGFGFDRTSAWADMISRRAQEASRRAEQRSQAAMRRTEEQIRQAAERELRRADWSGFPGMPVPPPPPSPKATRVTEQERLMVLQMLQESKISVEQAEKLLAALEGRFEE